MLSHRVHAFGVQNLQTPDLIDVAAEVLRLEPLILCFECWPVGTSVTLSNVSIGVAFKGMWPGSVAVPDVGSISGQLFTARVPG